MSYPYISRSHVLINRFLQLLIRFSKALLHFLQLLLPLMPLGLHLVELLLQVPLDGLGPRHLVLQKGHLPVQVLDLGFEDIG